MDANKIQKKGGHIKRTGSVRRNFLQIQDIQDKPYQQINSPSKLFNDSPPNQSPQQFKSSPKVTSKKSKHIKLQPLGFADPKKIDLPENKDYQIEDDDQNPQREQQKKEEKQKKQKKTLFNFDSDKQQNDDTQQNKIPKNNKNNQINLIKKQSKQQKPQKKQQQNHPYIQNQLQDSRIPALNQSQLQQQQQNQNQHQNQHQQQYQGGLQRDNTQHFLIQRPILVDGAIAFVVRRSKQWLNKFWPQFNMHYRQNNQYFLSAKLTGNNASTTFLMCKNKQEFVENSGNYVGKVKANFIGNIINIYGPGYNPTDYVNKKLPIRQILATVEFQTNFFGSTRPRDFKAFVLKPGISYYKDLIGTKPGQDQIPLNQLYEIQENKHKILALINRKPSFNQTIKGYMLNFAGRVKKASVKNFILEDVDQPTNARVLFGKITDDQFRLDVTKPVTPIVGLGIALAQFGGKIGCQ